MVTINLNRVSRKKREDCFEEFSIKALGKKIALHCVKFPSREFVNSYSYSQKLLESNMTQEHEKSIMA